MIPAAPGRCGVPGQTAAATRGRRLSDSTFRFTLVIRFFRST
jgi:hypothetical protein